LHNLPLTGASYPDASDSPNIAQYIQNLGLGLEDNTIPRFATTAARDAGYAAYTAATGVAIANGMTCWTDDSGYWDRVGGAWVSRISKSYVDGQSGTLTIIGGWSAMAGYETPGWTLSSAGIVTLSGAVERTGSTFALGTGSLFQFATLATATIPSATVSPISWALLSTGTYPVRVHCDGTSALSVVGMNSGSGSFNSGSGFVNLDGVRWHI
jgi:hypothetical protein